MKKVLKFIAIGIIAAIVIKLLTIAIIMIAMKLREFAVNTLDLIENIYKGVVYPFTTSKVTTFLATQRIGMRNSTKFQS